MRIKKVLLWLVPRQKIAKINFLLIFLSNAHAKYVLALKVKKQQFFDKQFSSWYNHFLK